MSKALTKRDSLFSKYKTVSKSVCCTWMLSKHLSQQLTTHKTVHKLILFRKRMAMRHAIFESK